jgi:hypothetical protein
MRKIEFRGMIMPQPNSETSENGWVYGHLAIRKSASLSSLNEDEYYILKPDFMDWGMARFREVRVYPDSVGQKTDKTDCLGKPIYEGDIVKYSYCIIHGPQEEGTGVVFWDDFSAGFLIDKDSEYGFLELSKIEIVGNCFEQREK